MGLVSGVLVRDKTGTRKYTVLDCDILGEYGNVGLLYGLFVSRGWHPVRLLFCSFRIWCELCSISALKLKGGIVLC